MKKSYNLKVERNVPMPEARKPLYPFAEMKAGDSFAFPRSIYKRISVNAANWGKKHKVKFTVRMKKADAKGRCWRI